MGFLDLVWVLAAAGSAAAPGIPSLTIDCERPCEVAITLTNAGAQPLPVFDSQLPWSLSSPGLRVQAHFLEDGRATPLTNGYPPVTYLGEQAIAPGRHLRGVVDLNWIVQDLEAKARRGHVAVHIAVVGYPISRKAGDNTWKRWTLFIPRQSQFFPECPALTPAG